MTQQEFITTLGNLAVAESNRAIRAGYGMGMGYYILPSVAIAQSALETGWGSSSLMVKANAFFGIKAGGSWAGKVYNADTSEVYNGVEYNTNANFRAYDSLRDSVADYYWLLIRNDRYAGSRSNYNVTTLTPEQTITAIWEGGYATDPDYVSKIMSIINSNNLTEWDSKVDPDSESAIMDTYQWNGETGTSSGSSTVPDTGGGGDSPITGGLPFNNNDIPAVNYIFKKI